MYLYLSTVYKGMRTHLPPSRLLLGSLSTLPPSILNLATRFVPANGCGRCWAVSHPLPFLSPPLLPSSSSLFVPEESKDDFFFNFLFLRFLCPVIADPSSYLQVIVFYLFILFILLCKRNYQFILFVCLFIYFSGGIITKRKCFLSPSFAYPQNCCK